MIAKTTLSEKWIPYSELQSFFNYKTTQMAALLNAKELVVAKIGKRKFISRESVELFLDKKSRN